MDQIKKRLVIVTGANRGIGYNIVKLLLEKNTSKSILLTTRTLSSGKAILEDLLQNFPSHKDRLFLEELDIANSASVDSFVETIKTKYGGLDILVNNAGIASKTDLSNQKTAYEDAFRTLDTNFFSTVRLSEKLLSLLSDDGKILQVSSGLGKLENQGEKVRKLLKNPDITKEELFELVNRYLDGVKIGEVENLGFSNSAYYLSKALLNTYTRSVLRKLAKPTQQLYYYSPGWCKTDMGGSSAPRTPEKGAESAAWLIELPFVHDEKLDSKFIFDLNVIDD